MNTRSLSLFACLSLVTGCASVLPYTPKTVSGPEKEIDTILQTNSGGAMVEAEFGDVLMTVRAVGAMVLGQQALRYDQISTIEIVKYRSSLYRVFVKNKAGDDKFIWGVETLEDAQKLSDALYSLGARRTGAEPARLPTAASSM
jgi:hypothetical protein